MNEEKSKGFNRICFVSGISEPTNYIIRFKIIWFHSKFLKLRKDDENTEGKRCKITG